MADDPQNGSPKADMARPTAAEDAETRATRRELKQSSISEHTGGTDADSNERPATPADDVTDDVTDDQNEELKERLSSPKKKRGHDQLDPSKDEEHTDDASVASEDSSKDRASRSEPEKKRHRDADGSTGDADGETTDKDASKTEKEDTKPPESTKTDSKEKEKEKPETSASAFAASGFSKLTAGTSPFANLAGTTGSGFGTQGKAPLSSFASSPKKTEAQPLATAPKLSFGNAASSSPFTTVPSKANGFGSGLGGSAFGTASGVKPLSTFASGAAKPLLNQKSAKPFGAPDSDSEESEGEENGDDEESSDPTDKDRGTSQEKELDDKSKLKLHKVQVDDGEADEATILSVRAKMFVFESEAWKERGAGMLKINMPKSCVEFDDHNVVLPGSFDASGLDSDEGENAGAKVVRLLMRQDHTHRVVLNTAIIPAMTFQEKTSLKSTSVVFTAFEGDSAKPFKVTMRMTAANAKLFLNEVESVQRELQNR